MSHVISNLLNHRITIKCLGSSGGDDESTLFVSVFVLTATQEWLQVEELEGTYWVAVAHIIWLKVDE